MIPVSSIRFSKLEKKNNQHDIIYLSLNNNSIYLNLPKLKCPFGITKFKYNNIDKYSLNISLDKNINADIYKSWYNYLKQAKRPISMIYPSPFTINQWWDSFEKSWRQNLCSKTFQYYWIPIAGKLAPTPVWYGPALTSLILLFPFLFRDHHFGWLHMHPIPPI